MYLKYSSIARIKVTLRFPAVSATITTTIRLFATFLIILQYNIYFYNYWIGILNLEVMAMFILATITLLEKMLLWKLERRDLFK